MANNPTVTAVTTEPGSGTYGAGAVIMFDVALSEIVAVSGGVPTLTLNDGGTASYVGGSGTSTLTYSYAVAQGQSTADLAVTTASLNGATVKDLAGHPADLSGAVTNPAGTLAVSASGVSVTSITASSPSGTHIAVGQTVTFTLATSQAVTVTGQPELTLSNGAVATYSGLDTNGHPKFTYTVAQSDTGTADLMVTGFANNGGTVTSPEQTNFAITGIHVGSSNSAPIAVTTADVNGDGNADIITADSADDTVAVLLGHGDGTFQAQSLFTVDAGPASVTTADVNGDGKLDIITSNFIFDNDQSINSISVLLGNGDGTFQPRQTLTGTGREAVFITTADLNGDGKPDLIVANQQDNTVSVLLGNGNGTFQTRTFATGGTKPDSVAVIDANGDGKLDLVVVNSGSNTAAVLLGNGDGTFQTPQTIATGAFPVSVAAADLNGDGKPDFVVANQNDDDVSVLLGNGNGTFQAQRTFSAGYLPTSVTTADVDGDGKLDLVVTNAGDNTASVLLGNGDGTFQTAQNFSIGAGAIALATADLNGDGKPDFVTADYSVNAINVLLDTSTPSATFDPSTIASAAGHDTGIAIGTAAPVAHDDPDLLNIIGQTGSFSIINRAIDDGNSATIVDPGVEATVDGINVDFSRHQIRVFANNTGFSDSTFNYALLNSDFIFTSATVDPATHLNPGYSPHPGTFAIVNGAIVESLDNNLGIGFINGDELFIDFTVGLKEAGAFSGNLFADNGAGADSDPDGDSFSVTKINGAAVTDGQLVTLASGARLTIHANGTFSYDTNHAFDSLAAGVTATESFTYTITGGSTATASFQVVGADNAPTSASGTTLTIAEDTPAVFVGGNKLSVNDVDTDILTVSLSVAHGTLSLSTTGLNFSSGHGLNDASMTFSGSVANINAALASLAYSNTPDFNGNDALTFTVSDGIAQPVVRTVALVVTPVVDIHADNVVTNENTAVTIDANANDTFENPGHVITAIDGTSILVGGTVVTADGSIMLRPDGQLTYTPNSNFSGQASFTYTVTSGGVTETTGVNVGVNAVNVAPVITGDLSATVNEGGNVVITTTDLNFSDPDDNAAGETFTVSSLAHGSVLVNGSAATTFTGTQLAAGQVSFQHDGSETTAASFNVSVEDGNEDNSIPTPSTFNLTVNPVNDAPTTTGVPNDVTVAAGVASNIDLSGITFSDVDSGTNDVIFTITANAGMLSAASGGSVTVGGTGTGSLTLTGTSANIDTFLNTASQIKYTSAPTAHGDNAATLTLTANDQGHTGAGGGTDVALGTVHVDINEAPSLVVTTLDDVVDAYDGQISLREAVAYANAHAGADTITFANGLAGTIRLTNGTLSVTEAATINGGGHIVISGDVAHNDMTRAGTDITDLASTSADDLSDNVQLISASADLTLKGLTLTGGHTTGNGGAVSDSAVGSILTIEGSTVSGNSASGFGGGIAGSIVHVTGSTISDNRSDASAGGGIGAGNVTVTDSTISGNSSASYGGGLTGSGVTLTNTTVTGNSTTGSGGYGGGVYAETGTVTNSIVLGNVAKNASGDEIAFTYTKVGGNIIGRDGGGGADVFSGGSDVGDTTAAAVFAQTVDIGGGVLAGVLADNGGPVRTVALKASATNPALDGSDSSAPATDARGMATVDQVGIANTNGSAHDLGAYELSAIADTTPPVLTINPIAGDNVVTAAEGAATITVSGTALGAEDGQVVTLTLKTADGSTTLQTLTTAVSSGAWHVDLPPGATPAFPDGQYIVAADVSDAAGNPATEAMRTIRVDTHAPALTINRIAGDNSVNAAEGAAAITVSGSAVGAEDGQLVTLALKTADGATTLQTLTANVSGEAWHLDLPPGATPAFPDGNYLVTADVSDVAGNPAAEVSQTIDIDTTAPTENLISKPAALTNSNGATFTYSATDPGDAATGIDHNEVSLDGAAFVKAASGSTSYSGLLDGNHTFAVRAVDVAGNVGTAASYYWTIDTTAPQGVPTVVLTHDTGVVGDRITSDPSLSYFPADVNDTMLYSTDGTNFSTTAPVFATNGSADGPHTVFVREQDGVGNLGPVNNLAFTLDTTAPVVSGIAASPSNGNLNPGSAETFTLVLSEAVHLTGGTPSLTLNDGGLATFDAAATAALNDASKLVFDYVASAFDPPTTPLAVTGYVANGAVVDDVAGNHADLTHVAATFAGLSVNAGLFTVGNDTVTLPGTGNYFALAGDDTVFLTAANETIHGGPGSDIYHVESVGDTIFELANEGTDTVTTFSLSYYVLGANIENLTHTSNADFIGIGNAGDNFLFGGSGRDYLSGLDGNDRLLGGPGVANELQGGKGDDTYYSEAIGDTITEFANEGTDTVQTWLTTFKLPDNVENLTFVSNNTHTGIGNTLNNVFTASAGTDAFTGAGGNDVFKFAFSTGKDLIDTITDFNADNTNAAEHDHIDLGGRGLNFAALAFTDTADGVTIGIPGGDALHLKNVAAHSLDAGDFFF